MASSDRITVHKHSNEPTKAWKEISVKQKCEKVSCQSLILGVNKKFVVFF